MNDSSEAEYLRHYRGQRYDAPLMTVDVAIFTLHDDQLKVLLVKRDAHPCLQQWALPGGFINTSEDVDLTATAKRKLHQKTSVDAPWLEQVITVGNAQRDPRGWSTTVLYMALLPHIEPELADTANSQWWTLDQALDLPLAFDHQQLLNHARERLKSKTAYTVLPVHVLPAPFTLAQLQRAFELLMNAAVEKKSFRRRILNAEVLKPVGETPEGARGRPAILYQPLQGQDTYQFVRIFGR